MTPEQIKRLPKAKLVSVRLMSRVSMDSPNYRPPFFMTYRSANARGFFFGRLNIVVRQPWLERAARALHPEVFQ